VPRKFPYDAGLDRVRLVRDAVTLEKKMKCPACQSGLGRIKYEGVDIETCPDCRGVWLEGSRLRCIERRREVIVDEDAAGRATSKSETLEPQRSCPRCTQAMKKYRYGKNKRIIVDQCPACKGIWLDDGELDAIQHAHERWEEFVRSQRESGDRSTQQRTFPSRETVAAGFARNMTRTSLIKLFARWILSLVILLGPAVVIQYVMAGTAGLGTWGIYIGVWLVLLWIARNVEFCPDMDDLGWFGSWLNDPLSWSDDRNRFLLACKHFFVIPEFVANTFSETLEAVRPRCSSRVTITL